MAVYFAKGPTGLIKIGFSESPHSRLGEMGLSSKPVLLANIFSMADWRSRRAADRDAERTVHQRFAHLRVGRAEWFRPAPELWSFILDARRTHGVLPRPERTRRRPAHRRGGVPVATVDDIMAELAEAG